MELAPVFPLPNAVLFPDTVLPLHIFEPRYLQMVRDVAGGEGHMAIALLEPGFEAARYLKDERAYSITRTKPGATLRMRLNAAKASPVCNPAFVVTNWGDADAILSIDNRDMPRGSDFRYARRSTDEGTDLLVWIALDSDKPVEFVLRPSDAGS